MKNGYTHISVVLDRSGSMQSCASDTVGGFNQFVKDQQAAQGYATLTLVQFDDHYEIVHRAIDIRTVPPLEFTPRGSTALLDALGTAITETGAWLAMMPEEQRPEHVIFLVLTDGQENASREFKLEQIKQMVRFQTLAYSWQFVFLGADMNAIAQADAMGFNRSLAAHYMVGNTGQTYRVMAQNVNAVRSGSSSTMSFSDEDRKALVEEDKPATGTDNA